MSDKTTALERLNNLVDNFDGYKSARDSFVEITEALEKELAAERVKTHKEILTEALDKCGIEYDEVSPINNLSAIHYKTGRFLLKRDGSLC